VVWDHDLAYDPSKIKKIEHKGKWILVVRNLREYGADDEQQGNTSLCPAVRNSTHHLNERPSSSKPGPASLELALRRDMQKPCS